MVVVLVLVLVLGGRVRHIHVTRLFGVIMRSIDPGNEALGKKLVMNEEKMMKRKKKEKDAEGLSGAEKHIVM